MLLKKKKRCYFLHPAAAYGTAWVSRLILWNNTENRFFSFSKNMQVFMISTYTSQKPVTLRQPLHHTERVGVIIYKVPDTCMLPHAGKRHSHGGCRSQNIDFLSLADITGLLSAVGNILAWKHLPDFLYLFFTSFGKICYSQVIHKIKCSIIDSVELTQLHAL